VPGLPQYTPRLVSTPPPDLPVRLLTFYLPQFHQIPENDVWWGEGFTEWSNVVRGKPMFRGHYQPHVPGELGYYDLSDTSTFRKQIELAKLYGIAGFVFYFYWFSGRRLLEKPVLDYLADGSLSLPFCLCWANESWTRRWDGREKDVLVAQKYSHEDDMRFIAYVAKYLRDPRYIRVKGRPLLIVYRPELLPNAKLTARRWRDWCYAYGVGDLYLAYTQSFDSRHPAEFGMDAAIEFPPNNSKAPDITTHVPAIDPKFMGTVYDWTVFLERSRAYQVPAYKLFRGVATTWDNVPRKASRGVVFVGATPEGYREWLQNAVQETTERIEEPTERLVFINAWNEWAEGAHLEPDERYGYAFLQACRDALVSSNDWPKKRGGRVVHEAQRNGAQ
jgi:lipopolysaccharide biosynthesis protein